MSQQSSAIKTARIRNPEVFAEPEAGRPLDETAVLQVSVALPCSAAVLVDAIAAVQGNTGDPSEISVEGNAGFDANYLRDTIAGLTLTRNITSHVGQSEGLVASDL